MKIKNVLLGTAIVAAMGVASPAMAFDKGVSVEGDGGTNDSWSTTVGVNGHFNSVSLSTYAVGGDSVKTIDYKHQMTNLDSPLKVIVGLSGMKSDFSGKNPTESGFESGYALGIHVGLGYEFVNSKTSIDFGFTEEIAESRFRNGQVLDISITQQIAKGFSVKTGFRQVDREVAGVDSELMETGYIGLKFNF